MIYSSLGQRRAAGRCWLAMLASLLAFGAQAAERYWPPIVDPPSGQHTPGRFVWGDLVTSDVAAAADFYGKVFGWTFETYGGDDDRDTYTLALADGLPIGGMVFDQRAMKGKTPSARWIGLISVADVKASAAAVAAAGGKVVYEPVMLGERGETAVFRDPEGVLFGVVKSKNGDPPDYAGDVNEWYWVDLWTDDVQKAATFYRAVVGYEPCRSRKTVRAAACTCSPAVSRARASCRSRAGRRVRRGCRTFASPTPRRRPRPRGLPAARC